MAKKFIPAAMLSLTESIKKAAKPLKRKKKRKAKITEVGPKKPKIDPWVSTRFDYKNAFGPIVRKSERERTSSHVRRVVAKAKTSNNVVTRKHEVTQKEKEDFRSSVNLRTKYYVRKSIQCEICEQLYNEGFHYTDSEGYISYLCKSCASQVGGASGRKLIISTPMGGQNKRY